MYFIVNKTKKGTGQMDKKRKHILNKYDKNLKSFEYKSSFYTASALARPRARHTSPIYLLQFSSSNIKFDELDLLFISNWNFAGYSRHKDPVQTRKKDPIHQTPY